MPRTFVCFPRAVILVVSLLVLCVSCSRSKAEKEEFAPPAAPVARVLRGPLSSTFRVAGQFTPYQAVDLHAKVSGYIRRISVDIGDRVHSGQTVAVLEVPELQAQVAGAAAQVRHTESEVGRASSEVTRAESDHQALHTAYKRLQEAAAQRPGLIAQQELDDSRAKDQNAEAQIGAAKAALEAAKQQLGVSQADRLRLQTLSDYAFVNAPFNGVVVQRFADTGALIQAGTTSNTQSMPIVRIAQSDLLRLRLPVPEADVRYIQPGSQAEVSVGALHRTWTAIITRFTRDLDPTTRTMTAEIDVPNRDLTINPGMYAEIEIVLQHRASALSLLSQAILHGNHGTYVLALDEHQQVRRREVQLGIVSGNRTEILRGLSENEPVIVSGQNNYHAGEVVRPEPAPATPPEEG